MPPGLQISSEGAPAKGALSSWTRAALRLRPRPRFPPSLVPHTSFRPWPPSPWSTGSLPTMPGRWGGISPAQDTSSLRANPSRNDRADPYVSVPGIG
eukprot:1917371-Rhodomonas_salina.1